MYLINQFNYKMASMNNRYLKKIICRNKHKVFKIPNIKIKVYKIVIKKAIKVIILNI